MRHACSNPSLTEQGYEWEGDLLRQGGRNVAYVAAWGNEGVIWRGVERASSQVITEDFADRVNAIDAVETWVLNGAHIRDHREGDTSSFFPRS